MTGSSVPPDGTRLHAADLQERLGIMVQDSGEGYAIVDFDSLERVAERVNQLEKALAYENPRHPLLPPLLPVAGKDAKPPCLYPLPDGRRCLECETCHAGGGRGARVNQLEQALRRIAEGDVGLPRFSYDAVTAHQNSMDIAAEALSAAGEDAKP